MDNVQHGVSVIETNSVERHHSSEASSRSLSLEIPQLL
jgi:hypothetical protein